MEWRVEPTAIRCDNGPEYVSHRLQARAGKNRIRLDYIQPGKLQQNAYVVRYNRTVPYAWLGQRLLENINEVRGYAPRCRWAYSKERPGWAWTTSRRGRTESGCIPPFRVRLERW